MPRVYKQTRMSRNAAAGVFPAVHLMKEPQLQCSGLEAPHVVALQTLKCLKTTRRASSAYQSVLHRHLPLTGKSQSFIFYVAHEDLLCEMGALLFFRPPSGDPCDGRLRLLTDNAGHPGASAATHPCAEASERPEFM